MYYYHEISSHQRRIENVYLSRNFLILPTKKNIFYVSLLLLLLIKYWIQLNKFWWIFIKCCWPYILTFRIFLINQVWEKKIFIKKKYINNFLLMSIRILKYAWVHSAKMLSHVLSVAFQDPVVVDFLLSKSLIAKLSFSFRFIFVWQLKLCHLAIGWFILKQQS